MKVMSYKVGQEPKIMEIENTLEALQKYVGGYVETFPIGHGLYVICDEDAQLKGAPPNRIVDHITMNTSYGMILGDFAVVRVKNGDFESITDLDIKILLEK